MKSKYFLIFIIILFLFCSACKEDVQITPTPASTIKIGIVYPQTGEDKNYGDLEGNAYILAAEEINEQGGINGQQIELISKDDFSSKEIAVAITEELIEQDKVVAILGTFSSSCSVAMSKKCGELKTPILCSSGAVDEITASGNEWVFRVCAPSRDYFINMLNFLREVTEVKTMAVIYDNGLFGVTTYNFLKDYIKDKDVKLLIARDYTKGMINFKPLLKEIKETKPDLLYLIAYKGDAALLMKQAKEVDLNPKIFAGAGIGFTDPYFIPTAGENAEYILTVSQWDKKAKISGSKEFVENYTERFGIEPDYHAAICYASFMVLAEAIKEADGIDRDSIRESLRKVNVETVVGTVNFEDYDDFTNQNKHQMVILQIQGEELIPVYPKKISEKDVILPTPPWSER